MVRQAPVATSPMRTALWRAVLLLALLLSAGASAAELRASVDRSEIALEETLNLDVSIDEQVAFGTPDFSGVAQDFDILSTSKNNQYQSINGQVESLTRWRLTLAPRREGTLTIPALSFKGARSQPLEVVVNATGNRTVASNSDQPIYMETSLDKQQAYVQEQLLLTLRLFTSVNLNGIKSEDLTIADAQVRQVSEQQYQKRINGKLFGVVEVVYAIFPERSGTLTIPPLVWNVAADSGRGGHFSDPFFNRGQTLRLRSREEIVEVNAQPANYPNAAPWLPASAVTLLQSWSAEPEQFRVGEPITRTITLQGTGLTSAQLPPLTLAETDGLRYYPDQPQLDDAASASGINGSRTESYAIVPTRAGTFTLPEVSVSWWDTQTNHLRVTTLEAQTISVGIGADGAGAGTPAVAAPADAATVTTVTPTPASAGFAYGWQLACGLLALTNLLTLALLVARRRRQPAATPPVAARRHTPDSARAALRHLQDATGAGQPLAVRAALIAWARAHWAPAPVENLQDIRALTTSASLQDAIGSLDAALFDQSGARNWSAGDLLAAVQAEPPPATTAAARGAQLDTLYPV